MKIIWKENNPEMVFSSYSGIDEHGNKYFMPANKETCLVETVDGKRGFGWTPEEALQDALESIN